MNLGTPLHLLPQRITHAVTPDDLQRVTQPTLMLRAIADTGKHLYQGTVPAHVKARRRAANKAARRARRQGR